MRVSEKFALHETTTRTRKPTHQKKSRTSYKPSSRCSQPLSTNQTPHPTTKAGQQHADPANAEPPPKGHGPVVSKPNSVSDDFLAGISPPARQVCHLHQTLKPTTGQGHLHESLESPNPHTMWAGSSLVVLLRKEVIQPHLPVRLPCYDFVPIADPTFDGSLPQGVRPPASGVTDFHDVTGGVYKARERIHRGILIHDY